MTGRIALDWPVESTTFFYLALFCELKKKNATHYLNFIWIRSEHKYGELSGLQHAKWNISIDYISLRKFPKCHQTLSKTNKMLERQSQFTERGNAVVLIFVAVYSILFYESTMIDLSSSFQFGATVNNPI